MCPSRPQAPPPPASFWPELTSLQTDLRKRSLVTIEDLKTKIGTLVNGKQIKGERFDLIKDTNEVKLGHYRETFR